MKNFIGYKIFNIFYNYKNKIILSNSNTYKFYIIIINYYNNLHTIIVLNPQFFSFFSFFFCLKICLNPNYSYQQLKLKIIYLVIIIHLITKCFIPQFHHVDNFKSDIIIIGTTLDLQ
jgi:hypothetical protein